jgi:hypothetical protein
MSEDQILELKKTIYDAVQQTVNGKIDKINDKLDAYIKVDTEWKERAEPVIEMGTNVRGFGRVSLYIVGFIASVTGAIYTIIRLIQKK